jgi:hypothetical protein
MDECEKFFINLIKKNELSLDDVYKNNLIKKEFKQQYIGIYLNSCSNVEKEIIQYFKYFTNNLPLSNTLLMCDENTTTEEIIPFLYRSILCKQNVCFCIARAEYLSKENKTLIINIIKEIFEKENLKYSLKNMKSCLFIMTSNLEDELCKSVFNLKFVKLLENIKDFNKIKIDDKNIKIIYSDSSGVGKSTFIREKAKKEYIYFPVGGVISYEDILERLKKLDNEKNINMKKDLLFHVDLFDTEKKSLMNDFLYFILVTKTFGNPKRFY